MMHACSAFIIFFFTKPTEITTCISELTLVRFMVAVSIMKMGI